MLTARAQAIHAIACVVLAVTVLIASLGTALTEVDAANGGKRKRAAGKGGDLAIVVLADGADPRAAAREMGIEPVRIYSHVFTGFAGDISGVAAARSSRSSRVRAIAPDVQMEATGQVVPTGVQRIGQADRGDQPAADQAGEAKAEKKNKNNKKAKKAKKAKKGKKGKKNGSKKNRGNKSKPNRNKPNKDKPGKNPETPGNGGTNGTGSVGPGTDIAILDSGVTASSDLDVAGGVTCLRQDGPACSGKAWNDLAGHGTHVAGIIAAKDNDRGVVGIAPSARVWSVRVLGSDENGAAVGWVSDVIAGLDWVYQNRATIDVVNMSLGGWMTRTSSQNGPYQTAIRKVANAGIPVVVASGNTGQDVLNNGKNMQFVPAAYPEAITVSAFADSDGRPGGTGNKTCHGDKDDTFWAYSNNGSAVDIAAPGVCILSLLRDGGTVEMTGTSMAAPHVTGALALFATDHPDATEAQARNWLLTQASVAQSHPAGFTGDNDRDREPVLFLGP